MSQMDREILEQERQMATGANARQEGGCHYKGKPIEHWDFVMMHDIPYMEAQIIKYVMRWRKKNGMADLRKAKHFLEKLMEHEVVDIATGTLPPVELDGLGFPIPDALKALDPNLKIYDDGLDEARAALDGSDEDVNTYMADSGEPRGRGYVNQD